VTRRAVLVVSGIADMPKRYVLDAAAALGVTIAAVVDVEHVRQAHQLLGAGQADVILHCGDLPTVRRLAMSAHAEPGHATSTNSVEVTAADDRRSALRLRRPQAVS
jgi:hypothetical protein